jgi:hypothetical protein
MKCINNRGLATFAVIFVTLCLTSVAGDSLMSQEEGRALNGRARPTKKPTRIPTKKKKPTRRPTLPPTPFPSTAAPGTIPPVS